MPVINRRDVIAVASTSVLWWEQPVSRLRERGKNERTNLVTGGAAKKMSCAFWEAMIVSMKWRRIRKLKLIEKTKSLIALLYRCFESSYVPKYGVKTDCVAEEEDTREGALYLVGEIVGSYGKSSPQPPISRTPSTIHPSECPKMPWMPTQGHCSLQDLKFI